MTINLLSSSLLGSAAGRIIITNMGNIVIREQSPPERCEICHQQDRFDPSTNICSRCVSVDTKLKSDLSYQEKGLNKRLQPSPLRCVWAMFVLFIALFSWVNLFSEYGIWYDRTGLLTLGYLLIIAKIVILILSPELLHQILKSAMAWLLKHSRFRRS